MADSVNERLIAVTWADESRSRVRVLLAQDSHHASHAKRLLRKGLSQVEALDGMHGIRVTSLRMTEDEWNRWSLDGPPPVPET